jgi:hypothetical protein
MREVSMSRRIQLLIAPVIILLCLGVRSPAQITGDLVILSKRVGEYIDLKEREQYHIFESVKGFRGATIIAVSDSIIYAVFEIDDANGQSVVRTRYSLAVLKMMAEKIEHFEEIQDGTYAIGTNPVKLRTVQGVLLTVSAVDHNGSGSTSRLFEADLLPLAGRDIQRSPTYPMFKFMAGVSTYSADFSGVAPLTSAIEEFYRGTGYTIWHNTLTDDLSENTVVVGFSASVALSRRLEVALEVARRKGVLELHLAGFTVRYQPAFLDFNAVRAYANAGLFAAWSKIESNLGYGNQIGPVDNLGRYQMFYGIRVSGSERHLVPEVGAGIEVGDPLSFPFGFDVFAKYLLAPQITVSSQYSAGSVKTAALTLGISLVVYF